MFVAILIPLFSIAVALGFCLGLHKNLQLHQQLAIGYLLLTGIGYLWCGVFALYPRTQLLPYDLFDYSLVGPVARLMQISRRMLEGHVSTWRDVYYMVPETGQGNRLPLWVISLSLVAIAAAICMLRRIRLGSLVWFAFAITSVVASLWNIAGDLIAARWGGPRVDLAAYYYPIPLLLAASCALAVWLATVPGQNRL